MYKQTPYLKMQLALIVALWGTTNNPGMAAELDCMVKPEMYIELSSAAPGVLEKVLVDKGDHVSKGQVLAQLEASVEIAKAKQAKFEATNNGEINSRKAQLAFALRNLSRSEALYQRGSLSKGEKDKAETDAALAQTELTQALEQKKTAELKLQVANAQLGVKTIKSPIDGIVIDRYAMIGESVAEKALMKLAQVNPLRVELVAPTEYFGLIQKGMEVEIRPERPANSSFKATVTVVDQLIDPASGSFAVRMALPNPDDALVGGVNCIASFNFATPTISTISSSPDKSSDVAK
jgi:RND family efflux transporter MFP subunit